MSERVVVFLDYQNVYKGARSAFHEYGAAHWLGQIDPWKLGQLIVDGSPYDRVLDQVRVYRGRPDASKDSRGYGACTRQVDIWTKNPQVKVTLRTLRYPYGWPTSHQQGEKPQEKGIDVALALDFLAMAIRGEYEVGVIMSTDTDMKPALEKVVEHRQGLGSHVPRAEVAAWECDNTYSRRLSISSAKLWCHWLGRDAYDKVADPTDYTRES